MVTNISLGEFLPGLVLGGYLLGADMNSTADQPIVIKCPTKHWSLFRVIVTNPSTSLTTAQGSLYLDAAKTNIIMATNTAYSGLTNNTINTAANIVTPTLQVPYTANKTVIYLSLTTAQGAPATADWYIYLLPMWGT